MNTLTLLKDLTDALEVVQATTAAAAEAFKVSYAASVKDKVSAKVTLMEAETRAAHAKHEAAAALAAARAHVAAKEFA